MDEVFRSGASAVALGVESIAALLIAGAAIEAGLAILRVAVGRSSDWVLHRREIWIRFAVWLLLALEFELAADLVRTSIAPSWDAIGQLSAIAGIRTVLNYFLERDIDTFEGPTPAG
jgi:uncharacterized membrane protein